MTGGPRPFTITVDDEALADLHRRIDDTRWPSSFVDDWSDGADLTFVKALLDHWRHDFDWQRTVDDLNRFDQVLVDVDGIDVHAVHQHGVGPDPLPLVLSHGWPGSFVEWRHVIGPLADPAAHGGDPADAFDVVAPSLPGYGYSGVHTDRPTTPRTIAASWKTLMAALGYDRFGAHGGDWGSYVTSLLGLDFPESVVGIHLSMVSMSAPRPAGTERTEAEADYAERSKHWQSLESGYVAIQATKPQTLSYGLTDSPAALAAWVGEKWRAWSDCDGDLYRAIDRDDVLANLAVYWFTGTINSASRIYRESRNAPVGLAAGQRIDVPAGFLLEPPGAAPADGSATARPGAPPRVRAERVYDVARWTITERGGHFPALEIPEVFVDEVRAFFRPLRRH